MNLADAKRNWETRYLNVGVEKQLCDSPAFIDCATARAEVREEGGGLVEEAGDREST
jgi:hypothetical protein